jgi:hypothetical protein
MIPRTLAIGLVGSGLAALLLNPGTGRAQTPVDIRCVGFEGGDDRKALLHLHNADSANASVEVQWFNHDGAVRYAETLVVPPGTTADHVRIGDSVGVTTRIVTSTPRLVVDAEMIYDDSGEEIERRTVTCVRLP